VAEQVGSRLVEDETPCAKSVQERRYGATARTAQTLRRRRPGISSRMEPRKTQYTAGGIYSQRSAVRYRPRPHKRTTQAVRGSLTLGDEICRAVALPSPVPTDGNSEHRADRQAIRLFAVTTLTTSSSGLFFGQAIGAQCLRIVIGQYVGFRHLAASISGRWVPAAPRNGIRT